MMILMIILMTAENDLLFGKSKKRMEKRISGISGNNETKNAVSNSEDFPRKPSLDKTQGSN